MSDAAAPRAAGIRSGLAALCLAALPVLWIAAYLALGAVAVSEPFREQMLMAEPVVLPAVAALAIVIAVFSIARGSRLGRVLAIIAITAVVLQAVAIAAMILL